MTRRERMEKRGRRRTVRRIISVVVLPVLIIAIILLIANRDRLSIDAITRRMGASARVETFHFTAAGNTVRLLDDGLAVASNSGLMVYDRAGELVYSEIFPMARPVLNQAGAWLLAYDLGGTTVQLGNHREAIRRIDWERGLINVRVNENGWLAVSAEQSGTRGEVTVIDADGNPRYRVELRTGHLIAAELAADNRTLAILTLTERGGRMLWYSIDVPGDDSQHEFSLVGEVLIDFWFTSPGGALAAISDESLIYLSASGEKRHTYDFAGQSLLAYDHSGGDTALFLAPDQHSREGQLVRVQTNGRVLTAELSGDLRDIAIHGRYAAVLFSDRLILYRNMTEYASWDETEAQSYIQLRRDGTVLRFSSNQARLLVP